MAFSAEAQSIATRTGVAVETLFSFLGMIASALLLLATVKSKTLRSNCNFMIAFCATFDAVHSFGTLVELHAFFGDGLMNSFTCCALMFIPEIGVYAGCLCVLLIGFDRFVSIKFLTFYNKLNKRTYLTFQLCLILIFSSYPPYLMYAYYKNQMVACNIPAVFNDEAIMMWNSAMIIVNVFTLLPYVLTWRAIRKMKVSSATRKLFRSLSLVMVFEVGTWLLTATNFRVIHTLDLSDEARNLLRFICGYSIHFGITIKTVIYYTTSTDYRKALRNVLCISDSTQRFVTSPTSSGITHR